VLLTNWDDQIAMTPLNYSVLSNLYSQTLICTSLAVQRGLIFKSISDVFAQCFLVVHALLRADYSAMCLRIEFRNELASE
jgi:hypothetical protein